MITKKRIEEVKQFISDKFGFNKKYIKLIDGFITSDSIKYVSFEVFGIKYAFELKSDYSTTNHSYSYSECFGILENIYDEI